MAKQDPKKLQKRINAIKDRKVQQAHDAMSPFALTLKEFCGPLLAVAPSLSGPENAISLGLFAWNAAFLPEDRWRAQFQKGSASLNLDGETSENLLGIIEEMIRQKELRYTGDLRVVTKYETTIVQGEPFITVEHSLATKQLFTPMA